MNSEEDGSINIWAMSGIHDEHVTHRKETLKKPWTQHVQTHSDLNIIKRSLRVAQMMLEQGPNESHDITRNSFVPETGDIISLW